MDTKPMNAFGAYAVVAGVGAVGSLLIALIGFTSFKQVTDGAMWAIAAASAIPAVMAIAIASFINRSHTAAIGAAPGHYPNTAQDAPRAAAAPEGSYTPRRG
jgi:hypothetical protein